MNGLNKDIKSRRYYPAFREGTIHNISLDNDFPITVAFNIEVFSIKIFTKEGKAYCDDNLECVLFPSKENRDWNNYIKKYIE